MLNTHTDIPVSSCKTTPIYQPLKIVPDIGAAFTGKGIAPSNKHFSFQRPSASESSTVSQQFRTNLRSLARELRFDPGRLTLPNGAWPHLGQAIIAEDYNWVTHPTTGTIMPTTHQAQPVTYDAIATRSPKYILGVQGADCPAIFLCDAEAGVIGLAHAGWKPLVRGVVRNVVGAMMNLGAAPQHILAYISPGAGDQYNLFRWDDAMEPAIKEVFVQAGRCDLLQDSSLRHELATDEYMELNAATGQQVRGGSSFRLSFLAVRELRQCMLDVNNIQYNLESSIVDRYTEDAEAFKYHSYRREYPNHGLSMSIIYLTSENPLLA